jgi:hypothetical protein
MSGGERILDRGPILIDGQTGGILWSAARARSASRLTAASTSRSCCTGFCDSLYEVRLDATTETLWSRSNREGFARGGVMVGVEVNRSGRSA